MKNQKVRGRSHESVVVSVPLRKHPVEREGLDGEYICLDRRFRPCGVDFTARDVFDVVFIFYIVVFRGFV